MEVHVSEHKCRSLEPWDPTQRREIGTDIEIAVPLVPARERVAGHRIHLHLEREQVVAPFDAVIRIVLVEEELGVEALPHQATLHVGEGDDDGVDGTALGVGPQLIDAQHHPGSYSVRGAEETSAISSKIPTARRQVLTRPRSIGVDTPPARQLGRRRPDRSTTREAA